MKEGAGVGSPGGLLNRSGLNWLEVRCLHSPPIWSVNWVGPSHAWKALGA